MNIAVCTRNSKVRQLIRDKNDKMIFYMDNLEELKEQEFDLVIIDITLCEGKMNAARYQSSRTVFFLPEVTQDSIDKVVSIFYVGEVPFTYSFNGLKYTIDLNDIVYFESEHREVKGYYENGDYIRFYSKLDDVEKSVDESALFLRINKSCLVNCNYCIFSKDEVIIQAAGKQMKVSRLYQKSVRERLRIIKNM